ncbi:MAG: hypothetical protein R3Y32_05465 [Bacillota bacterium]
MFVIKNKFKNANVPRTIRFTDSMFEKLNQLASDNDISFNLLILQCCQYAIDNMSSETKEEE